MSTLHLNSTHIPSYAIVWIDHRQADVYHLTGNDERKVVINSHKSVQALHHQKHGEGTAVHPADTEFFARVLSALEHPAGVLVAGPGQAKFALGKYLKEKRPDFGSHVDHVELPKAPGEAEVMGMAKGHFPIDVGAEA